MFLRTGRWCASRPRRVIGAWLVLLLVLGGAVLAYGRVTSEAVTIPGSDSQAALDTAAAAFPGPASGGQPLVLHTGRKARHCPATPPGPPSNRARGPSPRCPTW
ncbi:hypothetical protein SF23_11575 [Streptomyces sp. MBRL 10]|nr:hypothetical protein SF23_11575 [Streptomyces sp. MBRL 10]